MEWKTKSCLLEPDLPTPSIIQVADGKSCFIIDYPQLSKIESFYDFFNDAFTGKTFISFSFHNDIKQIDDAKIKSFFSLKSKKENVDLENEYKKILNKKSLSLSQLTMEIFKSKLCKMEQVSNWNSRPLRKAQIHYAALDAHILVLLHQRLLEFQKDLIDDVNNNRGF
jgi:ribonuclease D